MVNNIAILKENYIRRYIIIGERRISNYWWASVVFLGALGFLLTGICSYFGISVNSLASNLNLVNVLTQLTNNDPYLLSENSLTAQLQENVSSTVVFAQNNYNDLTNDSVTNKIAFFPQGLLMSFYGSLGFLLSIYWWLLIFWNVGGGFNEFNKKEGFIRIFRWGYPGKNRRIDLSYSLKDVEAIRVELKQGLDPQRTIYMRLKGKREIPLTGIGQPLTLKEIEKQASELANFLQVTLEGL
uniref:Photosystem I assembly protein Ycf4 n=1 Tax=Lobochlamys culleus TaxID=51693 RepID=A0A0S2IDM9_9CHLO|nr:hypothetical chloroplast RF4 [Lobochlamys culleus]